MRVCVIQIGGQHPYTWDFGAQFDDGSAPRR